jgi:fumarylacetoacetate (FAA) hydrolase
LQAALDDWIACAPGLRALARALEDDPQFGDVFVPAACAAPLPRAYQWADGSAYVNHVELVRRARGARMPEGFWTDPLIYQGGSDGFLGPRDPIPLADAAWDCDLEGEVAVILGDVPQGANRATALAAIRLVMLVNDVSLRGLIPGELAKGFGFFQSKPASAFSPVAATPDVLGSAWREGKLHGALRVDLNGRPLGRARCEADLTFDFAALVVHAARTRSLSAGTIIGSGTVSNRGADGGPGRAVEDGGVGFSCIAELRAVETLTLGGPRTPYLEPGDRVQISLRDEAGVSLFGDIDQTVGGA